VPQWALNGTGSDLKRTPERLPRPAGPGPDPNSVATGKVDPPRRGDPGSDSEPRSLGALSGSASGIRVMMPQLALEKLHDDDGTVQAPESAII
jgi:hypothetical protein